MKLVDSMGNEIGAEIDQDQQNKAQGAATEFSVQLAKRRDILTADQLASLISPGVKFEDEYQLKDCKAFFFTINGVLHGRKIDGALFAGECILTYGNSVMDAKDLAVRGLRATVDLLHEEYATRNEREAVSDSPIIAGLDSPDIGGRRAKEWRPTSARVFEQRDRLQRMIRDAYNAKAIRS
jgi:hypothetical protein